MPNRIRGTKGELPGNIAGALDYQCLSAQIPAFMIELGSGSRYQADVVAQAERSFTMLARHLGIVNDSVEIRYSPTVRRVVKRHWVTFEHGGLFVPEIEAGVTLRADALIGHTINLHGDVVESIRVAKPVVVIGLRRDPVAHTGERAAFVATEWDDYRVE